MCVHLFWLLDCELNGWRTTLLWANKVEIFKFDRAQKSDVYSEILALLTAFIDLLQILIQRLYTHVLRDDPITIYTASLAPQRLAKAGTMPHRVARLPVDVTHGGGITPKTTSCTWYLVTPTATPTATPEQAVFFRLPLRPGQLNDPVW